MKLTYGLFDKSLSFRNNSLVTEAEIRKIEEKKVEETLDVRAVTMTFEGPMRERLKVLGWNLSMDRRVPYLVTPNSINYKDSTPQLARVDFPYRTTLVWKLGTWEVVEMAERSDHEKEIEECEGSPTTVVTFFHREVEDINYVGTIHTGEDDPFMRPHERERMQLAEGRPDGWFGKSLEDAVYEEEDHDEDVGMQPQGVDDDTLRRPLRHEADEPDEIEEIEIDGEKFTQDTTLSKLRAALKGCGLPRGKNKADNWRKLANYHRNLAENMGA